ncbi:MAG: tRNA (adenosine(37)-N6)-threonylcarbamoyltransferase complex dimerization subunit type 1 TsaB [Pirellula sp.]
MTTNLLALETSGRSGSVAISRSSDSYEGLREALIRGVAIEGLIACINTASLQLDARWGSAKTLAPAIERLLCEQGLATRDLDAIAVVGGPGSFTGLRVGIATAKVMAYALDIPVVAVDTLDVIARQFANRQISNTQIADTRIADTRIADKTGPSGGVWDLFAVVDAFRGQSFWGRYRVCNGECIRTVETRIDDNEWLAVELARSVLEGDILVAGPSIQKLRDAYQELLQVKGGFPSDGCEVDWCEGGLGEPQATAVAGLGWEAWLNDQTSEVFGLLPMYYRSSAAEEKRTSRPTEG